ncbi:MAG: hypothetical protein M9916_04415 [Crocinitomicaceae bacterium]|nr:hypothetical protein [Crocinitomicaceae bacterium]
MKRLLKSILFTAITISFLMACGKSSNNRPVVESVSAFLNGNETIVGFGSVRLNDILSKTGYEQEPKIKAFVMSTFSQLQSSINMETPIYYAIEGPISGGNPAATYLFMEVKNSDSLKTNLSKNGFEVNEAKDFQYVSDGDMNLSFDKHIVAVLIKSDVEDEKSTQTALRKKLNGDVSSGYISDILKRNDDVSFGFNLSNLYATSNTDLENLSVDKQKELTAMLQNSFVEGGLNFKNGEMSLEVNNRFSDALKQNLFFMKDGSAKILNNLGAGAPKAGLSLNLDAKKMQEFLTNYLPEAIEDLKEDLGGPFAIAMMAADNDISKLIDGRIGALLFGDASNIVEGLIPDINFFIGLAGQGKNFGETIKEMLASNLKKVELVNSGVAGFSSLDYVGKGIQLPQSAEGFGKNTVDFFLDFTSLDATEFDLDGGMRLLEIVKSVSFNYSIDGGKLVLKTKDNNENILKQVLQKTLEVFEDQLAI